MLTIKEAKKIPFSELDDESKEYFYETFKRYVVRKQISDNSKKLTSLFIKKMRTTNPSVYTRAFNDFNSSFARTNLISHLKYDEVSGGYLRGMSEEMFNYHLNETFNTFERKVALICYSGRPSERIPNRLDYPAMVAYANMQTLVFELAKRFPKLSLSQLFSMAAKQVHTEFEKTYGKTISSSSVAETRTDYKALGRKSAPVWKGMLEHYSKELEKISPLDAARFVLDNFVLTKEQYGKYTQIIKEAENLAINRVMQHRLEMEQMSEEMPGYYDLADYDEVYSTGHIAEVQKEVMTEPVLSIFGEYLSDPIFDEKTPKTKQ